MAFHPVADNVLTTGSTDNSIRIWDIELAQERQCISEKLEDSAINISYNYDGSLFATASRDKVSPI